MSKFDDKSLGIKIEIGKKFPLEKDLIDDIQELLLEICGKFDDAFIKIHPELK